MSLDRFVFFFLCELKLQIIMLPSFGHFGPWRIFCVSLFEKMVRSAKTTHFSGASGCGRSSWPRTPACWSPSCSSSSWGSRPWRVGRTATPKRQIPLGTMSECDSGISFINIFSRGRKKRRLLGGAMSSVVWLPCRRQGHVLTPASLI